MNKSKITIAHGHRHPTLYNNTVPAVESANAKVVGVTITCTTTESIQYSFFCDLVIEAEFENERDMTLFLLGASHSAREDLEMHLHGSWRDAPFDATLVDLLLTVFSKYTTTEMEAT